MSTPPGDGPWVELGSPPTVHLYPRAVRGGLIVTLIGEADLLVERELRLLLAACLDRCARLLVLEVSNLFVDVRGFGALYSAWRAGRERGIHVSLAGPSRLIVRMSAILAEDALPTYPSVAEALAYVRKRTLER